MCYFLFLQDGNDDDVDINAKLTPEVSDNLEFVISDEDGDDDNENGHDDDNDDGNETEIYADDEQEEVEVIQQQDKTDKEQVSIFF